MSETSWGDRLGSAATSTLAGVAGGAMLGPPGMIVGGLVGLARSLTSQPHAEDEKPALQQVAQALTGIANPDQQVAALQADPVKANEFRVQALRIRAETEAARQAHVLALVQAANEDRIGARAQMAALVSSGSALRWGAAVVTLIILTMFGFVIFTDTRIDADLKETLKVLSVAAASYWIGSSAGSASKDNRLTSRND